MRNTCILITNSQISTIFQNFEFFLSTHKILDSFATFSENIRRQLTNGITKYLSLNKYWHIYKTRSLGIPGKEGLFDGESGNWRLD